ncbi:MAG: hypothetical protein M1829_001456 [Trizodia sp. TS-e1964]|nr:MAG: hypothetical protein M1829_001456 [Trizodia sp. TS-e1964]
MASRPTLGGFTPGASPKGSSSVRYHSPTVEDYIESPPRIIPISSVPASSREVDLPITPPVSYVAGGSPDLSAFLGLTVSTPAIEKEPISNFQRINRRSNNIPSSLAIDEDVPAEQEPIRNPSVGVKNFPRTKWNAPDRFIPSRHNITDRMVAYRTTKSVHLLSDAERLMRNESESMNPMGPVRGRTPGILADSPSARAAANSLRYVPRNGNVLSLNRDSIGGGYNPQAIGRSVWTMAGSEPLIAVPDGRGGMFGSGTNAPMYNAEFLKGNTPEEESERYVGRLAMALGIDQVRRVYDFKTPKVAYTALGDKVWTGGVLGRRPKAWIPRTEWKWGEWINSESSRARMTINATAIPVTPFRVLDAPTQRNDFYASTISYDYFSQSLAVGLGNRVFIWSESKKVLPLSITRSEATIQSLSFSSQIGKRSILALGRTCGLVSLWSINEKSPRFESKHIDGVSCVKWKPIPELNNTEDLLVGDVKGNIFYYCVQWPVRSSEWQGSMNLVARVDAHYQQICGFAWSMDGTFFASGSNDNDCLLYECKKITGRITVSGLQEISRSQELYSMQNGLLTPTLVHGEQKTRLIPRGKQTHTWRHGAAVKAIAFCPWQSELIATGGGSTDRAVHFYHTTSGACLATINVYAQVTAVIWSTTRREILVTMGYAQPEHNIRMAVFSWPGCKQISAIPYPADVRALYSIPYPYGPNHPDSSGSSEGVGWGSRTMREGGVITVCSDNSLKFYEVWAGKVGSTAAVHGVFGGSSILQEEAGIEQETNEVIR